MTLRILHVNCVIDAEGRDPAALLEAWPTVPAVATAVARAGADVTVLQASRTAAEYRQRGVTYRFMPEPGLRRRSGPGFLPWRLSAAVRREAPDVVHFNGLDFPCHVRAICRAGAPVLVQDHASSPAAPIGRLRGWGFSAISAAAFTSSAQADAFLKNGQLPAGIPIFAIPESSSSFTGGNREEARRETGVFGDPALLWVAHLNANKDPLTILHAVQKALPALSQLQLWCAFIDKELLPDVEKILREDPRLAAHVHLLGRVSHDHVQSLCRACDFFLLGSRREGSGYALLESLACGVTPIVTNIPACEALTGGGEIGALVPIGDADAFAAAILSLAQKPREDLRAKVLSHFTRNLSFDAVGARLIEAYSAIAGKAPSR